MRDQLIEFNEEDEVIIFDTETTGLEAKNKADMSKQPYVIEYAGIKLNWKTLEEVDRLEFMAKPPILIPPQATAVHQITDDMVKDEFPFSAHYDKLVDFTLGVRYGIAHNYSYDRNMIFYELKRMGKQMAYPYFPNPICTVELTYSLNNFRLNLTKLVKLLLDEDHANAHRAMPDVEKLADCVRALREKGML